MSFGETTHPKARKPYKYVWCGEQILLKEEHAHFVGKWEGKFQNWRMHTDCYNAVHRDGDILMDGFEEYIGKRGSTADR